MYFTYELMQYHLPYTPEIFPFWFLLLKKGEIKNERYENQDRKLHIFHFFPSYRYINVDNILLSYKKKSFH